jgi:hypothetical protein
MVVLVIDEVDKAPTRLIETLLHTGSDTTTPASAGAPAAVASSLLFVGIANSLNYPNEVRVSSTHASPTTVLFKPYSAANLFDILTQRCHGLIHVSAMHLLSRKVSAMNGDVRGLLNIAHSAIKGAAAEIAKGTHTLCRSDSSSSGSGSGSGDTVGEGEGESASQRVLALPVSAATAIVKNADLVKLMQRMGVGASREHETVETMPPVGRMLLVALVTADLVQPMTMPDMHGAFNTYAEMVNCNTLSKEEVRSWTNTLVSYMLLSQSDASSFGRRRVDPDKVTYKLQCSAVNLLRVRNLESMHKPHVQRYVDRLRADDEEAGRLLGL